MLTKGKTQRGCGGLTKLLKKTTIMTKRIRRGGEKKCGDNTEWQESGIFPVTEMTGALGLDFEAGDTVVDVAEELGAEIRPSTRA